MTRVEYVKYGRRDTIVRKVSEQEKGKILCLKCKVERKRKQWNQGEAVYSTEGKVQQDGTQTETLKGTTREKSEQREMRRTFKILREVQLDIGVEKVDRYEGVTVKVLLDSGITEMFID